MANEITVDRLVEACGDQGQDGGITIRTRLEPLAGAGAPVKPAIYAPERRGEAPRYQFDHRWWGEVEEERRQVDAIVIDNVPSQANRLEAALERLRPQLGLPEIVLDLSGLEPLPAQLPRQLSSFRFPHRQADAYLRDAKQLDGKDFKSDLGKPLFEATVDRPLALLTWFPQALLFGFWHSHLGKKGVTQAKLARSWTSEIVGYEPASGTTQQLGLKGDPINLSRDEMVRLRDPEDSTSWYIADDDDKAGTKASLSGLGHGQVPIGGEGAEGPAGPMAVSFRHIVQQATLSFAGLRRIWVEGEEKNAAARALVASLGLVAHAAAFGRSFSLRSGCEVRPQLNGQTWTWIGRVDDIVAEPLDVETATDVFRACVERAQAAGLPVGRDDWPHEPLRLIPNDNLARTIRNTYPLDV